MEERWLRLKNETPKAYQAFELYRNMGLARSIQKVGEELGKNPKALARLSSKYGWVERARAFDAYTAELHAKEQAREIVEMHRRHAQEAREFQEIALEPLKKLKERLAAPWNPMLDEGLRSMSTTKLLSLVLQCSKMHRMATEIEIAARDTARELTTPPALQDETGSPANHAELLLVNHEEKYVEASEALIASPESQGESLEEKPVSSGEALEEDEPIRRRTLKIVGDEDEC